MQLLKVSDHPVTCDRWKQAVSNRLWINQCIPSGKASAYWTQNTKNQQSRSVLPLEVSLGVLPSQRYVSSGPPLLSVRPWSLSAACRPSGFCGSFCVLCGPHRPRHRLPFHSEGTNIEFSPSDLRHLGEGNALPMMSGPATPLLMCALNIPHNTLQGQLYTSCMTWVAKRMWVHFVHLL